MAPEFKAVFEIGWLLPEQASVAIAIIDLDGRLALVLVPDAQHPSARRGSKKMRGGERAAII